MSCEQTLSLGEVQPKSWGSTQLVCDLPELNAYCLEVKRRGFSSIHLHREKWNYFYVESGRLEITCFPDYEQAKRYNQPHAEESRILTAGESLVVPVGLHHEFFALSDCRVWEAYWTDGNSPVDQQDIVRFTKNGICPNA